jgi:hypothetical protein
MSTNAALAFCTAALAVALARNVLTADERTQLAAHIASGAADLEGDGYALADEVLWVMSNRCRSFVPADLANLVELHRTLWSLS